MPIVPRNLHTKYGLNTTQDKGVTKQNVFDSDSLTQTHRLRPRSTEGIHPPSLARV